MASNQALTKRFLRRVDTTLEDRDISGVLQEEIPPGKRFAFGWATFEGPAMRHLQQQLVDPYSVIGDDVVDYFVGKLTCRRSGLLVNRWSSSDLQIRPQTLIIIGNSANWSLVEVQLQLGTIVHYKHSHTHALHGNTGCQSCLEVSAAVDKLVCRDRDIIPRWKYRAEFVPGPLDRYGLSLLWVLHLRQGYKGLFPMPPDYRSILLRDLRDDIKAASLAGDGSGAGHIAMPIEHGTNTPAGLRAFWISFGEHQGFGSRLWNKVLQLNGGTNGFNLRRASELLQIPFEHCGT